MHLGEYTCGIFERCNRGKRTAIKSRFCLLVHLASSWVRRQTALDKHNATENSLLSFHWTLTVRQDYNRGNNLSVTAVGVSLPHHSHCRHPPASRCSPSYPLTLSQLVVKLERGRTPSHTCRRRHQSHWHPVLTLFIMCVQAKDKSVHTVCIYILRRGKMSYLDNVFSTGTQYSSTNLRH